MKTTIRLDDALLDQARRYAEQTGRSLTRLIEDALREMLARRQTPPPRRSPVKLPTFGGRGLLPGVSLDDSRELLDRMEERKPSGPD